MRLFIFIAFLFTVTAASSQSIIPGSFIDYNYRGSLLNNKNLYDTAANKKKWFVSKYSSISTSFSFFKGGNATVISAPMGLQLNRRLNNNLFAFAGASIAPAYISFNGSNFNTDFSKVNTANSFNSKTLGIYSRAELGLQYINDERTFSISGSIGIERNNYSYPAQRFNNITNQNFQVKP